MQADNPAGENLCNVTTVQVRSASSVAGLTSGQGISFRSYRCMEPMQGLLSGPFSRLVDFPSQGHSLLKPHRWKPHLSLCVETHSQSFFLLGCNQPHEG